MSREDWAYLAGLLEGEGALMIGRRSHRGMRNVQYEPSIVIAMTDEEPVRFCASVWEGKVRREQYLARPQNRTSFRTLCPTSSMEGVLRGVLPLFQSQRKRREAQLLLSLCGLRGMHGKETPLEILKYRNWLWEEMQRVKDVRAS